MDFETFKEELANSVKERLDSRRGEEYSVTLNKVDKANETYDAVTVRPESSNIGVKSVLPRLLKSMRTERTSTE